MPKDFVGLNQISSYSAHGDEEFLRIRLELMSRLERSLDRSRWALLALDLEGIRRETREQLAFLREFEAVLRREPALAWGAGEDGGDSNLGSVQHELRRSVVRVRASALLQAALLARLQGKLRVLGNMLAGATALYRPPSARWPEHHANASREPRNGAVSDLCRA